MDRAATIFFPPLRSINNELYIGSQVMITLYLAITMFICWSWKYGLVVLVLILQTLHEHGITNRMIYMYTEMLLARLCQLNHLHAYTTLI